jgi:hypothetical protein
MSSKNKDYTYSYADFTKSQKSGKEKQRAYAQSNDDEKEDVHLKYSKRFDTVTIDFGTKKVHYNLDIFIDKYIDPYLKNGVLSENPLNLTPEHITFFMSIRSKRAKRQEEIKIDKKKSIPSELAEHGITDRASYKKWCIRNHPDKVHPDQYETATELFKRISVLCESLKN